MIQLPCGLKKLQIVLMQKFSDILGKSDIGTFYKRRDYSRIVNGKNPIVCHAYMGDDIEGKNIIVSAGAGAGAGSAVF